MVILACALALAACANTVRGVGRDVKSTANAVDDTVNKP
ncbi:MAG: entericidin A/B family lipoprotein [Mesorhizobium sp.]|nr:MAG: entericidin A/B family lipoprotein [Mesorhizobium sp.]RWB15390.1 MAG: entericidin A/B family lipoprotein [Mesorhizobium sp.]